MSSSTDPGAALLTKLASFAQGHAVLDRGQQAEAHTLAAAASHFLQHRMQEIVAGSGPRALLVPFQPIGQRPTSP